MLHLAWVLRIKERKIWKEKSVIARFLFGSRIILFEREREREREGVGKFCERLEFGKHLKMET